MNFVGLRHKEKGKSRTRKLSIHFAKCLRFETAAWSLWIYECEVRQVSRKPCNDKVRSRV